MEPPSSSAPATLAGARAEQAARTYLEAKGLHFVVANYRSRFGEIDLVMQHEQRLIFIEVRLRTHRGFGGAAASVDVRKQQKIIASAEAFLQHHPEFSSFDCRFDVVAMQASASGWQIEWLPAAFTT